MYPKLRWFLPPSPIYFNLIEQDEQKQKAHIDHPQRRCCNKEVESSIKEQSQLEFPCSFLEESLQLSLGYTPIHTHVALITAPAPHIIQ